MTSNNEPEHISFSIDDEHLTIDALCQRCHATARALRATLDESMVLSDHPVVVALCLENSISFVVAFFSIQRAGCIVCLVNPSYTSAEIIHQLDDCGARRLITCDSIIKSRLPPADYTFAIDSIDDNTSWWGHAQSDSNGSYTREELLWSEGKESPALLCYSSGTTGSPKAILIDERNLYAQNDGFLEKLALVGEDVIFVPIPLFHIYGIVAGLYAPLSCGSQVILVQHFDASVFGTTTKDATVAFLVPPMLLMLEDQLNNAPAWECSLTRIWSAAAALDGVSQVRLAEKLGSAILQIYGITEVSGVATCATMQDPGIGTIGKPLRYIQTRIDEEGELFIAGPQLASYYNNPAANDAAFVSGWYKTGDLAKVCPDGNLQVVGRSSEMIKHMGFLVSPIQIEGVILEHASVADVCVIGIPNERFGEIIVAMVVGSAAQRDIVALCSTKLAATKVPHEVHRVETVIKSQSGKILRRKMRELYYKMQSTPSMPITGDSSPQECLRVVRSCAMEFVESIGDDLPFMSGGMTSLAMIQFSRHLSVTLDRSLPIDVAFNFPTIRGLAEHIVSLQNDVQVVKPVAVSQPASRRNTLLDVDIVARIPGTDDIRRAQRCGGSSVEFVPFDRWDRDNGMQQFGSFLSAIDAFDPEVFGMSSNEANAIDPQHRLLLNLAKDLKQKVQCNISDVSVILGASSNDALHINPDERSAFAAGGKTLSMAAGRIAYAFNYTETCMTVDTACSSSVTAINVASFLDTDVLIATINLMLAPNFGNYLSLAGMLSSGGRCFTFDACANGYVRAESVIGAQSIRPGGTPALTFVEARLAQDGRKASLTAPNGSAQSRLYKGVEFEHLQGIEAHGTGTMLGDTIETGTLERVNTAGHCTLVSGSKANVGHGEPTAGLIGVLVRLQTTIPCNAALKVKNPNISARTIMLGMQPLQVQTKRVENIVNSFGYSGTIGQIALRSYDRWKNVPSVHVPLLSRCKADFHVRSVSNCKLRYDESKQQLDRVPRNVRAPPECDVLVAGCGAAGICVAHELQKQGRQVTVIEKASVVGGTWRLYGNPGSRVNSSEPSYRFPVPGKNHNHSYIYEIYDDMCRSLEGIDVHTENTLQRVDGKTATVCFGTGEVYTIRCSLIILCLNRRLGVPRRLEFPGECNFNGSINYGLGNDTRDVDWRDKRVVILGMGAFAVEMMRTSLEAGAAHVTIVCNQMGTICPQILDWLNFSRPLRSDLTRSDDANAIMF